MSGDLAKIGQAARMLAEARTLDDLQAVRSIASAAAEYAKAAKLGLEAQNTAAEIKLRAERKAGELLAELKRDNGGDRKSNQFTSSDIDSPYKQVLEDSDTSYQEANRFQQVAAIPAPIFEEFIEETKEAGEELTTNRAVKLAANGRPHVANNSGNNEWYTPQEYIQAARRVMGGIDLDPASSYVANKVVGASIIYTIDEDGLSRDWLGRVWLNPPYAKDLIGEFVGKLCYHLDSGDILEAVLLVNNATETEWFKQAIGRASMVCFPGSRVKFWQADGTKGQPLQGQAILYFGESLALFADAFSGIGWIAQVING